MLMRRLFLLLAAVVTGALLLPANPAAAAPRHCHQEAVKNPDGSITYHLVCTTVDPGNPGTPGGGEEEDCGQDQANLPYEGAPFCYGGIPCQYTDNIVPLAPPATPAPEGQKWQARYCTDGSKILVLTGGNQPRPLIVQAQEAFGNLAPPAGIVKHSPDVRGIVSLPTWLWLQPGSFGRLTGSSAEGLVAVAVPDNTHWNTGDGASVDCAGGGVPESAACTHTYTRASARYDGTVTRTWVVHYEQGGNVINIPGAPVALTANTAWALSVAEAQILTGPTPDR
jgi:hypothetical protein